MDKFVVGFAFTEDRERVLLVGKNRPAWQKGLLNGIGGKIEPGEDTGTPYTAMRRECFEETGLQLSWFHRGVMRGGENNRNHNDGNAFEVHIFYAYDNEVINYEQKEDEFLTMYDVSSIITNKAWDRRTVDNLQFLIAYGISRDKGLPFMTLNYLHG